MHPVGIPHAKLLTKFEVCSPNNFPPKGRGLGHVTPKIFGIQSNLSSKLLELGTLNLVHSFVFGEPSGRGKNFPEKGRVVVT